MTTVLAYEHLAKPFRYLQWADYLHTVQVKSIQCSRQLAQQRGVANEDTSSRLLVIAVFKVHPLELVACLSVDRKARFNSGRLTG